MSLHLKGRVHGCDLLQLIDMVDERKDEELEEADDVGTCIGVLGVFLLDGGDEGLVEHVFSRAEGLSEVGHTLMESFWRRGSSCMESRYED